ncbi:ROK family protein [Actinospica sp.]|uniref:ROK family protein n=1 Tax=Actinospica sp. TaxID=1872142 RepID=UPI002C44DE8C|nr:ROK family protein [Actinospica sp.]HWG23270.1 ROK family protein [Actinospica sp.]
MISTTVIPAMDIGGTHVTAAYVDLGTRAVLPGHSFREPLDSRAGAEEIVAALVACASRLDARDAGGWAIALPGPFDYEQGVGRYANVGKFDALNGYDLRAALSRQLPGADADRMSFHNDAHAFLLGEWWAGSARGHRTAVGLTLGTGVGSCFLRDGQVQLSGPGVPPEGRVDLLRHEGKPLEETISRHAIRRAYARAVATPTAPDVREIAQRAGRGDLAAVGVFTQTFLTLGHLLGPCLAEFEASVLVVGGSIAASWDLIAEPLRGGLADAAPRIVLAPAIHPNTAPLLGAAYLAQPAQSARPAQVERLQ